MKHTVLFGNGFNRIGTNSISWDGLLKKLVPSLEMLEEIPYTIAYERILMQSPAQLPDILEDEERLKKEIVQLLSVFETNDYYKYLLDLGLSNYITTNYDHSLENSFQLGKECEIEDSSAENLYSIRRNKSCRQFGKQICRIWHIHGDIDNPKSIMLGLDQYCGSIGQIDSYLEGKYKLTINGNIIYPLSMKKKLKMNEFDSYSWIDLFFFTNVHIIGLSLDFSEIDLWWILNKRARLLRNRNTGTRQNKIKYYANDINVNQMELLKSFGIEVYTGEESKNHKEFYLMALREIEKDVKNGTLDIEQ